MTSHRLKTWPAFFAAIRDGSKPFDVRENDRDFQVGDDLVLEEFRPTPGAPFGEGARTGEVEIRRVGYILRGFYGVRPGWVVLGFDDPLAAEVARLRARLNTPELHDFTAAAALEGAHQRERWGAEHDAGKSPEDWFWLIGYLAGKALAQALVGNVAKAKHHCISTAAALANWHAAHVGDNRELRPGLSEALRP